LKLLPGFNYAFNKIQQVHYFSTEFSNFNFLAPKF
jgi:hypothetical protein